MPEAKTVNSSKTLIYCLNLVLFLLRLCIIRTELVVCNHFAQLVGCGVNSEYSIINNTEFSYPMLPGSDWLMLQ